MMQWDAEDEFYDISITGYNNTSLGTGLRKDAVREAISWANADEYPYFIPKEVA